MKSAVEIREGVCTLFSLLGVPKMIQLDNGKEFIRACIAFILFQPFIEILFKHDLSHS
jgi:hypothetical protein